MTAFPLDNFTRSSLQIYQTIAALGGPFSFYDDESVGALKSGVENPYFNFLLVKNEDSFSVEPIVSFFAPLPFECTFERNNQHLINKCKTAGLIFGEDTTRMELDLEEFHIQSSIDKNISIREVKNESEIRQWINITALGFKLSKSYIKDFFYPIFKAFPKNFKFSLCFLNHVPTVASLLFINQHHSTIFSLATRPQFRKQGLAYHLLQKELSLVKERGGFTCAVQASALGKDLYKKLGFQEINELSTYIFVPPPLRS